MGLLHHFPEGSNLDQPSQEIYFLVSDHCLLHPYEKLRRTTSELTEAASLQGFPLPVSSSGIKPSMSCAIATKYIYIYIYIKGKEIRREYLEHYYTFGGSVSRSTKSTAVSKLDLTKSASALASTRYTISSMTKTCKSLNIDDSWDFSKGSIQH